MHDDCAVHVYDGNDVHDESGVHDSCIVHNDVNA
jgi:hypothetical protein